MLLAIRKAVLIVIPWATGGFVWSQGQSPQGTQPPKFDPGPYRPICSTEKVNGNCILNIDRNYPITLPTFQMKRGAHVSVYVFHPYDFEALTLDAGTATAFESSDQASALVAAAGPVGKGAVLGIVDSSAKTMALLDNQNFALMARSMNSQIGGTANRSAQQDLARQIIGELTNLDQLLTRAIDPLPKFFENTKVIYSEVREIESAQPRPTADVEGTLMRGLGVPATAPIPWMDFANWRIEITKKITEQGQETTAILDRLPQPCQIPKKDPAPAVGPWLPSKRVCNDGTTGGVQLSDNPFAIDPSWDGLYQTLTQDIATYSQGSHDLDTFQRIQTLKIQLDDRYGRVSQAIAAVNGVLPSLIAKISPDMQTILANASAVRETPANPTFLGVIPPPPNPAGPNDPQRLLAPYKALAPQVTYTVNAQNEIASSLLSLPAATQKQALATITVLYAAPRFEGSAGTFFSLLPNKTFSNVTDTAVTAGVPASVDVRIDGTKTSPPLVIPFVAANYRISDEFTWMGRRRGAFYATLGLGLNPYNTQVEYIGGLSFSWRFLMFGPLVHLGHGSYLTQGEKVNQLWCVYGTPTSGGPPACMGAPPSPSTKMYWTGAFAFAIAVRIPTTYNATNH